MLNWSDCNAFKTKTSSRPFTFPKAIENYFFVTLKQDAYIETGTNKTMHTVLVCIYLSGFMPSLFYLIRLVRLEEMMI